MGYIFDTNVFYDLSDAAHEAAAVRLCELGHAGKLDLRFSPVAVIEVASRLSEDGTWFERLKRAASIVVDAKGRSLPDPEQRMREVLLDGEIHASLYGHWDEILYSLKGAPDVGSFQRGYDDVATWTRRAVNVEHLGRYREEYERQFVLDMYDVAQRFNPRYDKQCLRSKPAKLSIDEQKNLNTFLSSGEWLGVFVALLAARADAPAPRETGKLGVIERKTRLFRQGYEWVMRKLFCDGRHVKYDDKNDYNDMHLLIYLSDFTGDVVVSSDRKQSVLFDVGTPSGKVITLEEFEKKVLGV